MKDPLYGLVFDAGQIEAQVAALSRVLPAQTRQILGQERHNLAQASSGVLGFAAIAGLLLALWSASRGMSRASVAFTVYVANFHSFDKTCGSLGGVVVLLTWLYLSALTVLLGAAINAQSERRTRKGSTERPPRAMGQRHARAADTLGESTG
jgi:uncharacterized BrkB/YihY/UPF0761 family membrane protein